MTLTRDQLKAVLKSKPNILAGKAIEVIKAGGPVSELEALVNQGAAHGFIERDPSHPRSRYLTSYVLDKCFESSFGVVKQETAKLESGVEMLTATLGHIHQSEGREAHFAFLLSRGFPEWSNSYRSSLFRHILDSCFYTHNGKETRGSARAFAKILADSGRYSIQHYAKNAYGWIGHPEDLDFILSLGADPTGSDMIDCALTYVGCDPSGGYTSEDRIGVIRRLLELGAEPKKNLGAAVSWQHIRLQLEKADLIPQLAAFGVISLERSEEFNVWLERHKS